MTPQPERPEQGKFSKDETNFLKTHLPAYEALCHQLAERATGPKGTGSVKGQKKDWVLSTVFPEFVKEFSSDQIGGPQLQSLQTKIFRWFTNHSPLRKVSSGSTPLPTATSKRPRATNGPGIFAEEHKTDITEKMAEQQQLEGGVPKHVNLTRYHTIRQELYDQLTDEDRRAYEAKAAEKNKALKTLPDTSENFKNQQDIVSGVMKALTSLIGWNWGQYGEAAFFVQGAFRNADNDLKTFNVSVAPSAKVTSFSSMLPDYKNVLRAPFCEWAKDALPVHSPNLEGSSDIPAAVSPVPVVSLPFKSPSSESMVEVAVQNVARAGYLSITHAAINADQSLSVTTTNPRSGKKRTQMETEMEQEGNGMKKRAKITVPAREQSSRIKDPNYKNKHVNVRQR